MKLEMLHLENAVMEIRNNYNSERISTKHNLAMCAPRKEPPRRRDKGALYAKSRRSLTAAWP